ncbi:YdcH family protein [Oryzomicrobium sp.]|uniref:YdcH family protein n=1 Tax=Oryzomicrobium sp. TaxID=1911578 RepID=UPI002FDF52F1
MVIDPHDLHHEFPEYREAISSLKVSNAHFARLFGEYHVVNNEVVKAEEGSTLLGDIELEALKKQRLKLKDDLYGMLKDHVPA